MKLVKEQWCLLVPVGETSKYHYQQFNNITQEKWKKPATKWLAAGAQELDLALMLDASFNGKAPTKKTNDQLAANRERLDWIVNKIHEECSIDTAKNLCEKLERVADSRVESKEKIWRANFDALASFIEEEYPNGLDSSEAFMPSVEDIGKRLRKWYLNQLGYQTNSAAVTGFKRNEMEGLGITFDASLIERALEDSSAELHRKSIDKNIASFLLRRAGRKTGNK